MDYGFVRVAAATPPARVADCEGNAQHIIEYIKAASEKAAELVVFPELCITGYTCGDLFLQSVLINAAKAALIKIIDKTKDCECVCVAGLPVAFCGKLYNCAAVFSKGELLGIVPKSYLPNYGEFYEQRHFTAADRESVNCYDFSDAVVPFGTNQLFECDGFTFGVEICEDLWSPEPPSIRLVRNGADIIVNLSASNEVIGKPQYRRNLVSGQSGRLICGYVYCSAGEGESTSDMVFSGHNIIAENGGIIAEAPLFCNEMTVAELDVDKLRTERRRMNTFEMSDDDTTVSLFDITPKKLPLSRTVNPFPFVPADKNTRAERCETILTMQASGLKKRIEHIGCKSLVIGISGGLDSTLALLVSVRALDLIKRSHSDIIAVTMPCFGTTERTKSNAVRLCSKLGVTLREIDITAAVRQHFSDIGQDEHCYDVTFENSQARERTQLLMDIANKTGGIVIGTGDLSELALGFATYNGDHMSMYGVNCSVPKTLVRHLVMHYADSCGDSALQAVLCDIFDTPVSPELLPADNGNISQKTEDIVGPYELHDFYLYNMLRCGFSPKKISYLTKTAFPDYSTDEINKWLTVFIKRFFSQQFKRNCLPDGPKIGTVALSPRADWRMPSDAVASLWLDELNSL